MQVSIYLDAPFCPAQPRGHVSLTISTTPGDIMIGVVISEPNAGCIVSLTPKNEKDTLDVLKGDDVSSASVVFIATNVELERQGVVQVGTIYELVFGGKTRDLGYAFVDNDPNKLAYVSLMKTSNQGRLSCVAASQPASQPASQLGPHPGPGPQYGPQKKKVKKKQEVMQPVSLYNGKVLKREDTMRAVKAWLTDCNKEFAARYTVEKLVWCVEKNRTGGAMQRTFKYYCTEDRRNKVCRSASVSIDVMKRYTGRDFYSDLQKQEWCEKVLPDDML